MADPVSDETRLAAEIERLKAEFPKTRELYREVCALLFFRFGITPTANRLYQLVHRGSMGTPTAVLSEFWSDLREKSRVRIEHPDLPAELQGAAGELVATLWSRASAAASAALDGLRADVEAARLDAQQSVATLQADLARTETALEQRTSALLSAQVRIHELEQSLAARGARDEEVAQLQRQARERDAAFTQTRTEYASETDRLRASVELADTRLQAAEKRASLEIERERTENTRLQRDADAAASRAARAERDARAEIVALRQQLDELRHRNGTLEGQLAAMREASAGYTRELNAWRENAAPAKNPRGATRARPLDVEPATQGAKSGKATAPRKTRSGVSRPRSGS
ncbi:DNA-binding protein [Paraburkholderia caballeronis]|uniref:DNA-binding protein n=1 Tax=Paraburkholderia caballeronis TaxID=416943 RepID=UPI0010647180|nr:DNA-binding protein [Paraburkholderia caballeronis]TDV16526.1 plasmid replication DNA-binding protein KfrA [Paraburkholderia caballeronis]TDV18922.1 plasmid replication DNA-binding protein KfrA [Paraburkholderia caballeronis]TDV27055.1 plasmid replication DNA-binding protein KfrA [Paraburkholderia caballeronis]